MKLPTGVLSVRTGAGWDRSRVAAHWERRGLAQIGSRAQIRNRAETRTQRQTGCQPQSGCHQRISAVFISLVLCLTFALRVQAQPATHEFNVPAQSAVTGIPEFARQAGIQILVAESLVRGKDTAPVVGTYTVAQGLKILLAGTALVPVAQDERTLTLALRGATGGADPQSPPGAQPSDPQPRSSLQLAQATPGQTSSPSTVENQSEPVSKESKTEELKVVVVTGTHIRGTSNDTAPLQVITRDDIERSGYSTTQQLVQSIPQNFSGGALGATEDGHFGNGQLASINSSYATGINLRGLGESSTLVLIDGHRVAASAQGTFVDVSSIPLSAIDRVEILTDGASAIYGADAVAGVVNFILRKDYSGQETRLSYGSAIGETRGEDIASQAVGRDWPGGSGMLSVQYQKLGALNSAERSFTASVPQPTSILPESHLYSALFNVQQQISPTFDVATNGYFTYQDRLAVTTGTNSQTTSSPTTRTGTANTTFGYDPVDQWRVEIVGSYSQEYTLWRFLDNPQDMPACGTGPCRYQLNFELWSTDLNATGTAFRAPGGDAKVALGASYRHESFNNLNVENSLASSFGRHVKSEFAEMEIPLIGTENALPVAKALALSIAVRRDDYSDFGATTNPRYGMSWKPTESLHLRGAYSTSFRAPNAFEQITGTGGLYVLGTDFPLPGGGTTPIFVLDGGNGFVKPESARNISAGFDYEPSFVPKLKLSVDYYKVMYRDRITFPPFDAEALSKLNVYGSLITQIPNDAAAQAYLNALEAQGAQYFDFTALGTGVTGVRYAYSLLEQNAAVVRQDGLDMAVGYLINIGLNTFQARVAGAYIREIETAYTTTSTPTNLVNDFGEPLHFRGRSDFSWSRGEWQMSGAVNYSGAYTNTSTAPYVPVSSWTTADIRLEYKAPYLKGFSAGLSAINIFNRNPPWVTGFSGGTNGVHFDTANASPLGRVIAVDARMAW